MANGGNNTVSEFAPGSGTLIATLTGVSPPLAFDGSGNLYVANKHGNTVSEFAPGSTTPKATLITGVDSPDALAFDGSGDLYVASLDSMVSEFTPASVGVPVAGGVVIRSSLPTLPMSLGSSNDAVTGINLTAAELAQIQTTSTGTVTIGDGSQTGNITFTTATPVTTPGASLVVMQDASGPGQIILDNSGGTATALNGNGSTITLDAGAGGIVAASANNDSGRACHDRRHGDPQYDWSDRHQQQPCPVRR